VSSVQQIVQCLELRIYLFIRIVDVKLPKTLVYLTKYILALYLVSTGDE